MVRRTDLDSAGRKQPSKYLRKKRATTAAKHRWKLKRRLTPGVSLPWNKRSFADKLKHLEAAKRGGRATGGQIKEQQRLFWNWVYSNGKEGLEGPFKTAIDTFEKIQDTFEKFHGTDVGTKTLAWEGFYAQFFQSYVLSPCAKRRPEELERELWAMYETYMAADEAALYGGLLNALFAYEDAQERKKERLAIWRANNPNGASSKSGK